MDRYQVQGTPTLIFYLDGVERGRVISGFPQQRGKLWGKSPGFSTGTNLCRQRMPGLQALLQSPAVFPLWVDRIFAGPATGFASPWRAGPIRACVLDMVGYNGKTKLPATG